MCIRDRYYKVHNNLLFIKNNPNIGEWKLVMPSIVEEQLILDYHIRYGHMGAMKVVKALEEQVYIKSIYRKVSKTIQKCHICQMVKCNNAKKEHTHNAWDDTHNIKPKIRKSIP